MPFTARPPTPSAWRANRSIAQRPGRRGLRFSFRRANLGGPSRAALFIAAVEHGASRALRPRSIRGWRCRSRQILQANAESGSRRGLRRSANAGSPLRGFRDRDSSSGSSPSSPSRRNANRRCRHCRVLQSESRGLRPTIATVRCQSGEAKARSRQTRGAG